MFSSHHERHALPQSSRMVEAVTALLNGRCDAADETTKIAAIRRESRIDLSDAEIKDLIYEAIEEGWGPDHVLGRLVDLDDGSDGIRRTGFPPR
jgi:hypothetical protein